MTSKTSTQKSLTAIELADRTGLSVATIWRLKNSGKIPFNQPGGEGHRVTFPPDALERNYSAQNPDEQSENEPSSSSTINSGPKPKWLNKQPRSFN